MKTSAPSSSFRFSGHATGRASTAGAARSTKKASSRTTNTTDEPFLLLLLWQRGLRRPIFRPHREAAGGLRAQDGRQDQGRDRFIRGISKPVVSKYLQACYKKLGLKKKDRPNTAATEYRDPERAAAIIDAATDPEAKLESIAKVFRDYGLPPIASAALLKRIRQKYFGVVEATRSLKSGEIVDALNHKIDLALRYMDDKTMSEASFRDLALGTAAMIEKRQLLRGEPTAIISDAERAKLHELLPLAIAEAAPRTDGRGPGYGEVPLNLLDVPQRRRRLVERGARGVPSHGRQRHRAGPQRKPDQVLQAGFAESRSYSTTRAAGL
jgi:hypothetical protein